MRVKLISNRKSGNVLKGRGLGFGGVISGLGLGFGCHDLKSECS
jgi:hypothetical protein